MLRFTKAEEQALRLSMRLAETGRQLTLSELANQENLPEPTVAKLLGQLRRGGVIVAMRGRNGGYDLAHKPAHISVADVLKALGNDPAPVHPCLERPQESRDCPRVADCGLRSVWRHLQNQVARLLHSTSLADLLQSEQRVLNHVDRVWPREDDRSAEAITSPVMWNRLAKGADIR